MSKIYATTKDANEDNTTTINIKPDKIATCLLVLSSLILVTVLFFLIIL